MLQSTLQVYTSHLFLFNPFFSQNEGEWLMSVDGGENHVMTIWDWDRETVIAKTKVREKRFDFRSTKLRTQLLKMLEFVPFSFQTNPKTVVCGNFSPLDDKSIITGGKQHLYFWRIINGKIFRDKKSGIFEVSNF